MPLHGLNPESLPAPIAHAYQRLTQETSDHAVITRTLKLLEVSLYHAVWVATAAYFSASSPGRDERVDQLLPQLRRPTLGVLSDMVLALDKAMAGTPGWWMDLELAIPRPKLEAQANKPARIVIPELVALRNKALHRTMGDMGANQVRQPVQDAVSGAIEALGILQLQPPVAVLGCEVHGHGSGSRRRRGPRESFRVRVIPLAGTGRQPVREIESDEALDKGLVYQPTPEQGHLLMFPFMQYTGQSGAVLTLHGFDGRRLRMLNGHDGTEERSELTVEDAEELEPLFAPQVHEREQTIPQPVDVPTPQPYPARHAPGPAAPPSPPPTHQPAHSSAGRQQHIDSPQAVPTHHQAPGNRPNHASIPEVVGGRYRILEQLGVGAVGTVFRVEHIVSGQISAIKILNYQSLESAQLRERFDLEARTLARLEHPGIVALRDFGHEQGRGYIVMEYLPGGSLARRIQLGPQFSIHEACATIVQIANAVAYAHSMGVIHRDLKPANLLTTDKGLVKVADFGLAHLRDTHPGLTGANTVGTPHYMAPEQIMGHSVDERTDVYALGAIFHELITGLPPYQAESSFAIQELHLKAPPPSVRSRLPGTSMQIERVVSRAMAKNPSARFASCTELAQELQALLQQPSHESSHGSHWSSGQAQAATGHSTTGHHQQSHPSQSAHGSVHRGSLSASSDAWGAQGFRFCRNQVTSFQHLTDLHYRATGHIKATRFSDRAIQDRSRYWQAVMDRAHDPEITYYRLTSVRSPVALSSVLAMVDDLSSSTNFHLGLTRAEHPFELVMRDGEEAIFCFHKSDFVVFASLAFDGEADANAQRIVALYEHMYDELWAECAMHVNFRHEIGGDPARVGQVQERIRTEFSDLC
jgi:serine/threonine protein kinase